MVSNNKFPCISSNIYVHIVLDLYLSTLHFYSPTRNSTGRASIYFVPFPELRHTRNSRLFFCCQTPLRKRHDGNVKLFYSGGKNHNSTLSLAFFFKFYYACTNPSSLSCAPDKLMSDSVASSLTTHTKVTNDNQYNCWRWRIICRHDELDQLFNSKSNTISYILFCFVNLRISGNAASTKNIHSSVSEQLKKNFAKSRWRVRDETFYQTYFLYYHHSFLLPSLFNISIIEFVFNILISVNFFQVSSASFDPSHFSYSISPVLTLNKHFHIPLVCFFSLSLSLSL